MNLGSELKSLTEDFREVGVVEVKRLVLDLPPWRDGGGLGVLVDHLFLS